MKPAEHIKRLLAETHRIAEHGHCKDGPSFVAVNDIEIAIHELRKAFENQQSKMFSHRGHRGHREK